MSITTDALTSRSMDRMPDDLLQVIFETALAFAAEDGRVHLAISISHVCRNWRFCALNIPTLWATLAVISAEPNPRPNLERIAAQLQRSAQAPLVIRWIPPAAESMYGPPARAKLFPGMPSTLDLVLQHTSRVRVAELHLHELSIDAFGDIEALFSRPHAFPLLTDLHLKFRTYEVPLELDDEDSDDQTANTMWNLGGSALVAAPGLRRLVLENVLPSWGMDGELFRLPSSLTHLHIVFGDEAYTRDIIANQPLSFYGMLNILRALPSIQSIRLPVELMDSGSWSARHDLRLVAPDTHPIPLPHLKRLEMGVPGLYAAHAFSNHISVHADCTVVYTCGIDHRNASLALLTTIFPRGLAASRIPPHTLRLAGFTDKISVISTHRIPGHAGEDSEEARLELEFYVPHPHTRTYAQTLPALCALYDLSCVRELTVLLQTFRDATALGLWTTLFTNVCVEVDVLSLGMEVMHLFCIAQVPEPGPAVSLRFARRDSDPESEPSESEFIANAQRHGEWHFPRLRSLELYSSRRPLGGVPEERHRIRVLHARRAAGLGVEVLKVYQWSEEVEHEGGYAGCADRVEHVPPCDLGLIPPL